MKQKLFLLLLMAFIPKAMMAYDVEVDGIYYYLNSSNLTASVGYGTQKYSGNVTIPTTIYYSGKTYSVTSIWYGAFSDCTGLTSITIPNSVTSIVGYVFSGCTSLTSITVDEGNTKYDSRGDSNAIIETSTNKLIAGCKNTVIPNSVTSIGGGAFWGCTSLQSITIPNSVTSIERSAFSGCTGLTSITVDERNTKYDSRGDCNAIIETSTNMLIAGCKNTVIPNSVTSIGYDAFSGCTGLTSITIPNSVTSIGDDAFYGCTSLTSITIPNSVTSIGAGAFWSCTSLQSITIPNSVTSIDYAVFSDCTGLTSITIPNSVTSIHYYAFQGCTGLTSITIPNSVTFIGEEAFSGCTGLTSITIPNSVTSIGGGAFWGCTSLQSVTVPNSVTSIGDDAFYGCTGLTSITIPNSVTSIGGGAFWGCTSLQSITIPNSVTSIERSAFSGCTGLTSITIPNSVTSIRELAFSGCTNLIFVTVENPSPVEIDISTFSNCANAILYVPNGSLSAYQNAPCWQDFKYIIEISDAIITFADANVKALCVENWDTNQDGNLSIDETYMVNDLGTVFSQNKTITSFDELKFFIGLTSIPSQAFFNCSALTSITLPKYIESIGINALSGCSVMTSINVDDGSNYFQSYDGVLFNKAKTTLIQYPLAKGTNYAVPVGTKTIGRDAFFNSKLSSIFLPSSLTTLEFDALGYCKYLTEINLPSNLQTIGDYAFDHCTGIRSIIIPTSVTSIGSRTFNSCNNLALVECQWTENPSALAADAFPTTVFENAVLLVPEGTRQLYNTADGWKNFRRVVEERNANITFADATVKAICVDHWDTNQDGELSFKEAAVVLSLDDAFTGNTAIKSFRELQFFTALAKIDDDAFNGCKLLTSVIVPDNVREIGKKAFYGCYKLTDITLPEGLEVINDYGISACINLTEINLPSTLTTLKLRAFYYDKKLTSISLPASITSIGAYAFATCDALMEVTANMETPCVIASTVFSATTFSNGTLYVPEGKQNLYRNTNYWSMFSNMVEMEAHATGISANNIALAPGESEKMTLSLNYNVPIVSYQFDVTMPEGLSVGSIESLTPLMVRADQVADATWRITAYSNNNTVIPANAGGLVSFYIVADRMTETGYKTVEFSDFVMTDESFQSIEVEGCTASVEVKLSSLDAGKGDVNLDGKVNVQDVVLVLNYIINNNTRLFSMDNADANSDGKINISDVSAIVALSMNSGTMNAAPAHAPAANLAAVTWDTSDGLSLTIGDAHNYVATQMDIITEGTLRLNGVTTEGSHAAAWQQIGDNRYRVLVFSNANDTFSAFGPHLFFDMEGDGNVTLNDVLLVDAEGEGYMAEPSSTGYTTGITTLNTDLSAPADVYSVSGQLVRKQTTSLKNLPAGIYIVNGKKMVVK